MRNALPQARPPDILEEDWQSVVVELASYTGWAWYHTHNSQHSVAGFPDLILARGPRLLAVELKTRVGKVTPAQQRWLDLLAAAGAETHIWRPADIDQVKAVLSRRHP